MTSDELNTALRKILTEFVDDGFKRVDISNVTFGLNKRDQFEKFLFSNRNMGLKPMNPIFNDIGFELHLIPVPKNDGETIQKINSMTEDHLFAFKMVLLNYLEEISIKKSKVKGIEKFTVNLINNCMNNNLEGCSESEEHQQ